MPSTRQHSMPIAVVGMACKFPGDATNPEKLWELCRDGRNGWSTIPQERFNHAAFYGSDKTRTNTISTQSGYFLSQDLGRFDATFFGYPSEIAATMDPQIRLQLESVYEAVESAGITLEALAGSQTSVFAACFGHDYNDSMMQDPDDLPRSALSGNGAAMIANRISHFYDVRGASLTIDTGCSGGLAAFHFACQSIRTGEAAMSIVTAGNLILNPDFFVMLSSLGVLSPDGKCFAWDDRANGYGRGEGISTIILKPLAQALADGDPIRAVVRESLVNQDGKTDTITTPSSQAQLDLINECHYSAGLDPRDTPYVEAHMTGTAVGDPIEATAISQAFGRCRPAEAGPVLVGSVKTNLGHTEAASGLAAVIKAVMSLEKGIIAPNLNIERFNPAIDPQSMNIAVPTVATPWPTNATRRASVNNFGYGGTNAHVILDAYAKPTPSSSLERSQNKTKSQHAHDTATPIIPKLIVLSSKHEQGVADMRKHLADYLRGHVDGVVLDDLAYTLNERRTKFEWRSAELVSTIPDLITALENSADCQPTQCSDIPKLTYVFTGQGAQWNAMGRELMAYSVYASSMRSAERVLQALGAPWCLADELGKNEASSRVYEPAFAQPLCVILQLCLVNLLASWGISPSAVVSHSSGEIAAAYAAGMLDFSQAIAVVYYRGLLTDRLLTSATSLGAMLAVGLGPADVEPYLALPDTGRVVIACVNSPSNVTLSGDSDAIEIIEKKCVANGVFARKLRTGAAYHSHHMAPMAGDYSTRVQELLGSSTSRPRSGIIYGSPVTGGLVDALSADNWVANLLQPVLFSDALASVAHVAIQPDGHSATQIYLEIGPHGALAGPIKQTLESIGLGPNVTKIIPILTRGRSGLATAQEAIARLACQGVPIDYSAFNNGEARLDGRCVITDLPSYPWNHSVAYWRAPRSNTARAHRSHAKHPLLGTRVMDSNASGFVWRNFLRVAELPWLRDHVVQSNIVFPAPGVVSMAIEAVRQIESRSAGSGYFLRDIEIISALLIAEDTRGTEVQLSLRPCSSTELDDAGWWEFQLHSVDGEDDSSRLQSRGFISCRGEKPASGKSSCSAYLAPTPVPMAVSELYKGMHERGIEHGPSFQLVQSIYAGVGIARTTFSPIHPETNKASMMSVHPTTLDVVLQSAYAALDKTSYGGCALLPRFIGSLYVSEAMTSYCSKDLLDAAVEVSNQNRRGFYCNILVSRSDGLIDDKALIQLDGLFYQSMGSSGASSHNYGTSQQCFSSAWHPDWTMMSRDAFARPLKRFPRPEDVNIANNLNRAAFHLIEDLMAHLTDTDIKNLAPHHQRWYEWMLNQHALAMKGEMAPGCEEWVHLDDTSKEALYQIVEENSVEGRMLIRLSREFLRILRLEITPLEIMMQDDLLSALYTESQTFRRAATQVKEIMQQYRRKSPASKILEVGGGTGGCTAAALAGLTQESPSKQVCVSRYDFTDISAGFIQRASDRFIDYAEHMTFSTLDIEKDPVAQSFEASSYDLVIAFQVLHATKDMNNTLSNVHKLLKPGGKLLLVETTTDTAAIHLIFGSLPGWWLGKETERTQSPNMPLHVWERILPQNGFSGLDKVVADCGDAKLATTSVIISTALSTSLANFPAEVSIIWPKATDSASQYWLQDFTKMMSTEFKIDTVVETIDSYEPNGKECIVFLEAFEPVLSRLTARQFYQLRKLLTKSKSVLWITKGSVLDGAVPEMDMVAGLFRTLRHETPGSKYVTLDIEANAGWTNEISHSILKVIEATFARGVESSAIDCQYAIKDSQVHIPRVYQHDENSASKDRSPGFERLDLTATSTPLRMDVSSLGLLNSLCFARDFAMENEPLQDDELEVEPKAFGLNFRDVLIALGQIDGQNLGYECSGIIKRVGANCDPTHVKAGDRVCCMIQGSFGNIVRTNSNAAVRIPDTMGFVEAASIPVVFITAYHALVDVARLEKGESVLIHTGSGGVGQAAIMIAQHVGAEVFVTAGTGEKREFLKTRFGIPDCRIFNSRNATFRQSVMSSTGGRGVDVVLNSLSGSLLKASWACVASLGRFVEIGKRDIEARKGLDMTPFRNGVTFAAIDLTHLMKYRSDKIRRVLTEVMKLWTASSVQGVHPIRQYPMSEAPTAFRAVQGGKFMGKTVLVLESNDLVPVRPQEVRMRFAANATYLIVGGTHGIGARLARHMAQRKCRNLILISRSATSKPESGQLQQDLGNLGCRVAILDCDVADLCQLRKSIQSCTELGFPPVQGVVHGAVALNDSIFEHMTYQKWQSCMKAKIDGTWNLHHALPELDFFILLSSILGVVGNNSQGNYCAASTFQDSFARHRRSLGLPTISLDVGPTLGAGNVAATTEVQHPLTRKGFECVELEDLMSMIDRAMLSCCESTEYSQVMSGLRTFDSTSDAVFKRDRRFSPLERDVKESKRTKGGQQGRSAAADSFKQGVATAKTMADAVALCVDALVQQVASIVAVAIQSISPHKPLATYGIDSLVAVEMRNWLFTALRADLTVFEVMQSQDLVTLARKAAENSKIVRDAGLVAPV